MTTMGQVHKRGCLASGMFFVLSFFFYSTNFYLQTTSNHHNGAMNGHHQWRQMHKDEDNSQLDYQAQAFRFETRQRYVFFGLHFIYFTNNSTGTSTTSLCVPSQPDDMDNTMMMVQGHKRGPNNETLFVVCALGSRCICNVSWATGMFLSFIFILFYY